jgi:hypothetical protein
VTSLISVEGKKERVRVYKKEGCGLIRRDRLSGNRAETKRIQAKFRPRAVQAEIPCIASIRALKKWNSLDVRTRIYINMYRGTMLHVAFEGGVSVNDI